MRANAGSKVTATANRRLPERSPAELRLLPSLFCAAVWADVASARRLPSERAHEALPALEDSLARKCEEILVFRPIPRPTRRHEEEQDEQPPVGDTAGEKTRTGSMSSCLLDV